MWGKEEPKMQITNADYGSLSYKKLDLLVMYSCKASAAHIDAIVWDFKMEAVS